MKPTITMVPSRLLVVLCLLGLFSLIGAVQALASAPPEIPDETQVCVDCHRLRNPALYQQWSSSKHCDSGVGCYDCHEAQEQDADAFQHEGHWIATVVSPADCAGCHEDEAEEFADSRHSKGGRILGSVDNVLAEVIEGNRGMVTPSFEKGISSAAVSGCWQCHGSEIKVLPGGKLDPATWPNIGIGRINPDGSEGACSACHSRHTFSASQARYPDTCGKCHMGPDHPQKEIYYESKHGIVFSAFKEKLNMDCGKWVVGEDYSLAPTCATCHMSATPAQAATKDRPARSGLPITHDVGLRISWNNRPAISVRPEVMDAKMALPGAKITWQTRRNNMRRVCANCHEHQWIDNFYVQYDSLIELYHDKFARPGLELYDLAKPLLRKPQFSNHLDFIWFEIWHHEGRRARHGASMMGPDYTHWHGTYEVAKHFYSEYIPELQHLVQSGKESGDSEKVTAAEALAKKINEVLNSDSHRWYANTPGPAD